MDTDQTYNDAKRVAKDVKEAATQKTADLQDELLTYTQKKPLMALLAALGIGILLGKTIL